MIKSINAWRGIFAIVIVLLHSEVPMMESGAKLGVSFFFIASGFLTTLRHHDEDLTSPGTWWTFWLKRAQRIYPLHWIALACYMALYVLVMHKSIQWPQLAAQAALVQCWVPDKHYFFAYNGVSWFLGALLFHYACFPLINRYFSRWRLQWQCLLIVAVIAALAWWLPQLSPIKRIYTYVCPAFRLGDFVFGAFIANVYRKLNSSSVTYGTAKATFIEAIFIIIVLEVIFIDQTTELFMPWNSHLIWWIPVAIIVFSSAMLNGQEGFIGRLLCTRPIQLLGQWSLEIYLFQHVASTIVNYFISPIYGHFGLMAYDKYVYTQVPLLIIMAWAIHKARKIKKSHSSLQ